MNMTMSNALSQYKNVGIHSALEDASQHRLIQMLLEGALTRIATAIGHANRGEIGPRGENISLAISIVNGLQGSLNLEKGGDIAFNLDRLYAYMVRRLFEANREDDVAKLSEVRDLLLQIKEGWDGISQVASGDKG